jgi:hypothetical protein
MYTRRFWTSHVPGLGYLLLVFQIYQDYIWNDIRCSLQTPAEPRIMLAKRMLSVNVGIDAMGHFGIVKLWISSRKATWAETSFWPTSSNGYGTTGMGLSPSE